MSNRKERFTELCTGHVLNALSAAEEQEFQQMLENPTKEELELLDDLKAITAEMAVLAPAEEPSAHIKAQIMAAVKKFSGQTSSNAVVYRLGWYRAAAAAAVIFVFSTLGLLFYTQSLQKDMSGQSEMIAQQEATIRALQTEVERKEELLTILEARDVDLVIMDGMAEMSPNGYGKVVWDKEGGNALLQVANIPTVPSDKDYQLWFIVNGQPLSAGVFAVNDPGRDNFFKIEQLQSSASEGAFAITMEPKGGMPQPTGDMYLLGNM